MADHQVTTHRASGIHTTGDGLPSQSIFDRYIVEDCIGQGGMGKVYSARDSTLNRKIALKVVSLPEGEGQETGKRVLREAQAMAQISHPNLVTVFDVGCREGRVFIAMEFVDGATLRRWVSSQKRAWQEIVDVCTDAALALQETHLSGLVHRDFKPDNVMVDRRDRAKVMDFGLVRRLDNEPQESGAPLHAEDALAHPLSEAGAVVGTPAYMSPEQIFGHPVDARADQFSFCVSMFEALYGYRPFRGKSMAALARYIVKGSIQLPRRSPVPRHILDALIKGMSVDPQNRHDDMSALITALHTPYTPNRRWVSVVLILLMGFIFALTRPQCNQDVGREQDKLTCEFRRWSVKCYFGGG